MTAVNVSDDEWEPGLAREGYVSRLRDLGPLVGGERIGATVYAIEPGERMWPYHFHYAEEEWLLVLDGEPTLRTPHGSQSLRAGDIIAFRRGPDGAHEVKNETSSPIRVLMISTKEDIEIAVFPDSGKIAASGNRLGAGERVRLMNRPENNLDYYDGED